MSVSMTRMDTDILVSGGGIAGLTAACAFGAAGHRVICVDPAPTVTEAAVLANHAAAVEVGRPVVQTVTPDEIKAPQQAWPD